MKHIKKFNGLEDYIIDVERTGVELGINEKYNKWKCEEVFSPLINWDMIEDIKDMSLEYLDMGYTLYLSFIYLSKKNEYELFNLSFNHAALNKRWYDVNEIFVKFLDTNKLFYRFNLKRSKFQNYYNELINNELEERILDAYPYMKNKISCRNYIFS